MEDITIVPKSALGALIVNAYAGYTNVVSFLEAGIDNKEAVDKMDNFFEGAEEIDTSLLTLFKAFLDEGEFDLNTQILTDELGQQIQNYIYSFEDPVNDFFDGLEDALLENLEIVSADGFYEPYLNQLIGFQEALVIHLTYLKMFIEYFLEFVTEDVEARLDQGVVVLKENLDELALYINANTEVVEEYLMDNSSEIEAGI